MMPINSNSHMKVEQFNKFLLKQYKIYFMILDQQTCLLWAKTRRRNHNQFETYSSKAKEDKTKFHTSQMN